MMNKKRKVIIGICICTVIALVLITVIEVNNKKKERRFKELFEGNIRLNKEEKENITQYLSANYRVYNDGAYFSVGRPRLSGSDFQTLQKITYLANVYDHSGIKKQCAQYKDEILQPFFRIESLTDWYLIMKNVGEEVDEELLLKRLDEVYSQNAKSVYGIIEICQCMSVEDADKRYGIKNDALQIWNEANVKRFSYNDYVRFNQCVYMAMLTGILDEEEKEAVSDWYKECIKYYEDLYDEVEVETLENIHRGLSYIGADNSLSDIITQEYNFSINKEIDEHYLDRIYNNVKAVGRGKSETLDKCCESILEKAYEEFEASYVMDPAENYYAIKLADAVGYKYDKKLIKEHLMKEINIEASIDSQYYELLTLIEMDVLSEKEKSLWKEHIRQLIDNTEFTTDNSYEIAELVDVYGALVGKDKLDYELKKKINNYIKTVKWDEYYVYLYRLYDMIDEDYPKHEALKEDDINNIFNHVITCVIERKEEKADAFKVKPGIYSYYKDIEKITFESTYYGNLIK